MSGIWSNRLSPSWNSLTLQTRHLKWRPTFNFCFKVAVWTCSTLCFLLLLYPTISMPYSICVPLLVCPTLFMFHSLHVPLPVCPTPCISHSLYALPLVCPTLHLTLCVPCSVCPTLISYSCISHSVCPTPYWKGRFGLWGEKLLNIFLEVA